MRDYSLAWRGDCCVHLRLCIIEYLRLFMPPSPVPFGPVLRSVEQDSRVLGKDAVSTVGGRNVVFPLVQDEGPRIDID